METLCECWVIVEIMLTVGNTYQCILDAPILLIKYNNGNTTQTPLLATKNSSELISVHAAISYSYVEQWHEILNLSS